MADFYPSLTLTLSLGLRLLRPGSTGSAEVVEVGIYRRRADEPEGTFLNWGSSNAAEARETVHFRALELDLEDHAASYLFVAYAVPETLHVELARLGRRTNPELARVLGRITIPCSWLRSGRRLLCDLKAVAGQQQPEGAAATLFLGPVVHRPAHMLPEASWLQCTWEAQLQLGLADGLPCSLALVTEHLNRVDVWLWGPVHCSLRPAYGARAERVQAEAQAAGIAAGSSAAAGGGAGGSFLFSGKLPLWVLEACAGLHLSLELRPWSPGGSASSSGPGSARAPVARAPASLSDFAERSSFEAEPREGLPRWERSLAPRGAGLLRLLRACACSGPGDSEDLTGPAFKQELLAAQAQVLAQSRAGLLEGSASRSPLGAARQAQQAQQAQQTQQAQAQAQQAQASSFSSSPPPQQPQAGFAPAQEGAGSGSSWQLSPSLSSRAAEAEREAELSVLAEARRRLAVGRAWVVAHAEELGLWTAGLSLCVRVRQSTEQLLRTRRAQLARLHSMVREEEARTLAARVELVAHSDLSSWGPPLSYQHAPAAAGGVWLGGGSSASSSSSSSSRGGGEGGGSDGGLFRVFTSADASRSSSSLSSQDAADSQLQFRLLDSVKLHEAIGMAAARERREWAAWGAARALEARAAAAAQLQALSSERLLAEYAMLYAAAAAEARTVRGSGASSSSSSSHPHSAAGQEDTAAAYAVANRLLESLGSAGALSPRGAAALRELYGGRGAGIPRALAASSAGSSGGLLPSLMLHSDAWDLSVAEPAAKAFWLMSSKQAVLSAVLAQRSSSEQQPGLLQPEQLDAQLSAALPVLLQALHTALLRAAQQARFQQQAVRAGRGSAPSAHIPGSTGAAAALEEWLSQLLLAAQAGSRGGSSSGSSASASASGRLADSLGGTLHWLTRLCSSSCREVRALGEEASATLQQMVSSRHEAQLQWRGGAQSLAGRAGAGAAAAQLCPAVLLLHSLLRVSIVLAPYDSIYEQKLKSLIPRLQTKLLQRALAQR
jgi:hypothetical protein